MDKNKNKKTDNHKKTINQLQNQLAEMDNKFKRALADYHNLAKRYQSQKANLVKLANQALLDKLLPVVDDLQRAQDHLGDQGLSHILHQLQLILSSEGLIEIDSDSKAFNPETMDCTEVVPGKKDIVVKTLLKGYLYHDKVLRPAKVEVGSGAKK